jgi:hypothetical protein
VRSAIRSAARDAIRQRRFAIDAACAVCKTTDRIVMMQTSEPPICCDCAARRSGQATVQDHHPLGAANDPLTIPLRLSTHRFFSDRQYDWPVGVIDNPGGSESVRRVALRYALTDLTAYFAIRTGWRHAA